MKMMARREHQPVCRPSEEISVQQREMFCKSLKPTWIGMQENKVRFLSHC